MIKSDKLNSVQNKGNRNARQDIRSHEEKLIELREVFGRRKDIARRSGKINDCSINKIAKDAGVDRLWILGHRKVKQDVSIEKAYEKLRRQINKFRSEFLPEKNISEDKARISELEGKLDSLKASIEPTFIRIAALEKKVKNYEEVAADLDTSTTHLIARNLELEEHIKSVPKDSKILDKLPIKRVIICPDAYRKKEGKYVFGDKVVEANAWAKAIEQLNKYMSRKIPMRLYLLVGMPFSGKSTWAQNPNIYLESDRHPVIFDAINLTIMDRIKLIQPLLRFTDIPKVCVYFDTDMELIRVSNGESDGWERAKFKASELTKMFKSLEKPDPYQEIWIDELKVVRRK